MEQYVITTGKIKMPLLSVHNLDSLNTVRPIAYKFRLSSNCSGTSLIWTPLGQTRMFLLERCPHFRGYTSVALVTSESVLVSSILGPNLEGFHFNSLLRSMQCAY